MDTKKYVPTLRKSVAKNRRKMLKAESGVLAGGMEPIHEYRVALRRIRSALRLIEDSGEAQASKLRKKAAGFARSLGHVRDLDVLIERANSDKAPEAWLLSLARERQHALAQAKKVLTGKKYGRWKDKLKSWLESETDDSDEEKLPKAIRAHADAVIKHDKANQDGEYHALRVTVKRLRYLLEFFEKDQSCIAQLADIQDVLGEHHDLAVATEMLDEAIALADGMELAQQLKSYRAKIGNQKGRMRPKVAVAEAVKIARVLNQTL